MVLFICYLSINRVYVAVGYVSIACAAIDPLIAGLAFQASSQLKILKDNVEHLGENFETFKDNGLAGRIRNCVIHHQEILKYVIRVF